MFLVGEGDSVYIKCSAVFKEMLIIRPTTKSSGKLLDWSYLADFRSKIE